MGGMVAKHASREIASEWVPKVVSGDAVIGLGLTEPTNLHVVVIVAVEDKSIGILVDAVSDILIIPKDEIRAVPEMERSIDEAYLSGLVTVEGRMVALLAVEKLFELENET